MTAPQLLAAANGLTCTGDAPCFWCGAPADAPFAPSDTFTGWSEVAAPSSRLICAGCRVATDESDRSKRPRFSSWVITASGATASNKGDIAGLRATCLTPPAPPFVIAVAVSGQKHLIYRAPVNRSRDAVTVQFELERVTYRPVDLAARLDLCGRLAAAAGKPSLAGPPNSRLAIALADYYRDCDDVLAAWLAVWSEPLSRLCAVLTPRMEDCRHAHPSDAAAPEATARPARDVRRPTVAAEARRPDGPGLFG